MAAVTDLLGNPVSLADPLGIALVNDFVGGFIACEARAVNLLLAPRVDPAPLPQAYAAALHMFAETPAAPIHAGPYIRAALASPVRASTAEMRLVHAVAAWVAGDLDLAIALHEEQALECPRDLASLKLGAYHLFNRGDAPGMLRLCLRAQVAAADVPYLHGMLAFGYEQCHFLSEAEHSARHGIVLCAKEPWAQHAVAHVMLTQGRLREGLDFMQDASRHWLDLNSFMRTHNWWHLALFALELGDHVAVLALYDTQVWGVDKSYSQDQINAVSLLARLELAGVDVGDRWDDLGQHLAQRSLQPTLPFLDMQYLYGLARAARPQAALLLQAIAAHAAAEPTGGVWRAVGLPACRGLLAHAQGDWAQTLAQLGLALPRLLEIGGSHAQRDLFELFYLDALRRSGRLVGAQHLLQQRLARSPQSQLLKHQAAALYKDLGLKSLASRVWS